MMKKCDNVIVIALLLAELFKILIYANYECDVTTGTQNGAKSQKIEYL